MEVFYAHFNLNQTQLLPLIESIVGAALSGVAQSPVAIDDQHTGDTQLVTFQFTLPSGEVGEVTLFVKKCVWKGKSEAVHYRYLAAQGIPTPRLIGAVQNADGAEVIFLEPVTSVGFREHNEAEWRCMLSLLALFNACPVTPEYAACLHRYEQVGQISAGLWVTGLTASPREEQIDADLRECGVSDQDLPSLKRAAHALFTQVGMQPRGLLHQDFLPDNFGWRGEREEMVVFDLHKNSLGPRFADVAPYLSIPDWSAHKTFLDDREDGPINRREAFTQHYLDEYARFGGARVLPETFQAEVSALFWAHKVTTLRWMSDRKQEAAVQQVLDFLHQLRTQ